MKILDVLFLFSPRVTFVIRKCTYNKIVNEINIRFHFIAMGFIKEYNIEHDIPYLIIIIICPHNNILI